MTTKIEPVRMRIYHASGMAESMAIAAERWNADHPTEPVASVVEVPCLPRDQYYIRWLTDEEHEKRVEALGLSPNSSPNSS